MGDTSSATGESGRATVIAGGGAFLMPFKIGSSDLSDVPPGPGNTGWVFTVEKRRLEVFGTLKFGVDVEPP